MAIAGRTTRRAALPGWTGTPAVLADSVIAIGVSGRDLRAARAVRDSRWGAAGYRLPDRRRRGGPARADADPRRRPGRGLGRGQGIGSACRPAVEPTRARRGDRHRADRRGAVGRPDASGPRPRHLRRRLALVPHAARCAHRPDRLGHLAALHRPALPELVLPAGIRARSRRRDPALRQRLPLAAAQHGLARARPVRGLVHRAAVRLRRDLPRRRRLGAGGEPAVLAPAGQREQRRRRDRALPLRGRAAAEQPLAGERARRKRNLAGRAAPGRPDGRGPRRGARAGHQADGRTADPRPDRRRDRDRGHRSRAGGPRRPGSGGWWSAAAIGTSAT